uniref:DUF4216 domain-containing protein n=1 Tax=Setaria viridis TaxID=4556 RepID=A0A4U6UXN5_SETVI|nr:hypothetical protein SEVIR_4G121700v2 [Setaria viridis]
MHEVTLFECDLYDVPAPTKSKSRGHNDPYILATQVEQVCYVKGRKKGTRWCSVLKMKPRTLFAMLEVEDSDNNVGDTNVDSIITGVEQINVEDQQEALTNWIRPDVQGLTGDASVVQKVVPMHELDHADISEVVALVNIPGQDEDIFFV